MEHLFNETKIILDLCGGTGAWSKPYSDNGYDVRLITLPEYDVRDFISPPKTYGVLAAPPCTEFSLARNGHPEINRDFKSALAVADACFRIAIISNPVFFAIENPIGHLSKWYGKYQFWFHPWWFGDPWTKRTALWGNFNPPKRLFINKNEVMTEDQIIRSKENRKEWQDLGSDADKAFKRAITPPGFAKAFYEANK